MGSILLRPVGTADVTLVSNVFIDEYMPFAHGDYVKLYLYLLRCMGEAGRELSVSSLADRFENTEKDIVRAIQYWEQKGLLQVGRDARGEIQEIVLLKPVASSREAGEDTEGRLLVVQESQNVPAGNQRGIPKTPETKSWKELPEVPEEKPVARPIYTAEQINCMKQDPQVTTLLSQIERLLKRLLKPNDVQLILYLYESLSFPPELILYLYRYCISMNKTHLKYIERVAVNWNRDGIRTVEQAEMTSKQYKKEYYTIARALGFTRALADAEGNYVEKWLHQWHFSLEVVLEACRRTVLQTQNPSFPYIDRILESWHKSGVRSIEDIKKEDAAFSASVQKPAAAKKPVQQTGYRPAPNRFTSFEQHKYSRDEMDLMEKAMLHNSEKKIRKETQYESYE